MSGRVRTLDVALLFYLATCAVCVVWPGMKLFGARVEPRVLGLPFALVWMIGWTVATFVVLAVYHTLSERERA